MKSQTTPSFWSHFSRLSPDQQRDAEEAYQHFRQLESSPALRFKRIGRRPGLWSIRAGGDIRAVGLEGDGTVTWFWIGHHAEYERLINE